jgi:hypothetical protein
MFSKPINTAVSVKKGQRGRSDEEFLFYRKE